MPVPPAEAIITFGFCGSIQSRVTPEAVPKVEVHFAEKMGAAAFQFVVSKMPFSEQM